MDASNEIKAEAPRLPSAVFLLIFVPVFLWLIYDYIPVSWINIGQTNYVSEARAIGKLIILSVVLIISFSIWKAQFFRVLFGYSFILKNNFIKIINNEMYVKEIDASQIDRIAYGDETPFWKDFNCNFITYKIYMKDNSKPIYFDIYIHFTNVEEINKILEARFGKMEYEKFQI